MAFEIDVLLPLALTEKMPEEAKRIYAEIYNRSWETYDDDPQVGVQDREAVAHRDAWTAVMQEFVHDEDRGLWYHHGEAPEKSEGEVIVDKLKNLV